jgi:hypothetical protein
MRCSAVRDRKSKETKDTRHNDGITDHIRVRDTSTGHINITLTLPESISIRVYGYRGLRQVAGALWVIA